MNFKNVSLDTWARGLAVTVLLVLELLRSIGVTDLDFDEGRLTEVAEFILGAVIVLRGYWKNNSFTDEAQLADGTMEYLKAHRETDKTAVIEEDEVNG